MSATCSTVATPPPIVGCPLLHTAMRKSWSLPVTRPTVFTAQPLPWYVSGTQPFFRATFSPLRAAALTPQRCSDVTLPIRPSAYLRLAALSGLLDEVSTRSNVTWSAGVVCDAPHTVGN